MLRRDLAGALEKMPAGTHAVLVYDSLENKREVLFNHLRFGVGKEGLVYVCAEETSEGIRKGMEGFGIEAGRLMAEGLLSIKHYDEVHIKNGKAYAEKVVRRFADASWEARSKGLKGLRGAGEMSGFFRHGKIKELLEYERAMDTRFSFPGKAICAYNLVEMGNTGTLDLLWPILKAHGMVIMAGPKGSFALDAAELSERDVPTARAAIHRQGLRAGS